jgi:hypothetical protein
MVLAAVTAQAGAVQQQIATAALKSNLDSQKSVLTLLGAGQQAPSLANVGDGVGGNVNIAA